ncbi:phosphatidate cytidylyltransferase [Telmatospirillum sp.]|uniref:phosphatidate cytidylyltransferase n=1 Tax=Telmatospirillum sp. TaxID=2079197 RepID=UPI002842DF97|nr:phosphatidate cytidylyltransferase [Telmatospirillum sp.]MDR3436688.1 phosphatidate cytidylyltransferase [Telmatospirillum sp.]
MLRQRILSALVLAPCAIAAVWIGSWAFVALAALAGGLMAWEWTRLCSGHFGSDGKLLALVSVVAVILGHAMPMAGMALIAVAALTVPWVGRWSDRSPLWMVAGTFYIGVPALSLVWLRGLGSDTVFWLLLVVWATDIGAYAAGRTIGGPKLMPSVSPKKTWAGLLGGMGSAAAVGAIVGFVDGFSPAVLAALSALLAVVAQAGDLAESWVKRHFGVKDSSAIIPGHGGVLDRLDGLLAASPVVAMLCLALGGGLSQWR